MDWINELMFDWNNERTLFYQNLEVNIVNIIPKSINTGLRNHRMRKHVDERRIKHQRSLLDTEWQRKDAPHMEIVFLLVWGSYYHSTITGKPLFAKMEKFSKSFPNFSEGDFGNFNLA